MEQTKKVSKIKVAAIVTLMVMVLQCIPVVAYGLTTVTVEGKPRISPNKKNLNFLIEVTYFYDTVGGFWIYDKNTSKKIRTVYRTSEKKTGITVVSPYKKGAKVSYKVIPFNRKQKPFGSSYTLSHTMK